jgi:hypothetical protein
LQLKEWKRYLKNNKAERKIDPTRLKNIKNQIEDLKKRIDNQSPPLDNIPNHTIRQDAHPQTLLLVDEKNGKLSPHKPNKYMVVGEALFSHLNLDNLDNPPEIEKIRDRSKNMVNMNLDSKAFTENMIGDYYQNPSPKRRNSYSISPSPSPQNKHSLVKSQGKN